MRGEQAVDPQWFADEGFWEEMAELMFDRRRLEGTASEVDRIVDLIGAPPGGAVLDMPCGFGRHSLALARRGYRVTGVDLSPGYLRRLRGELAGLGELPGSLEVLRADMRSFRREAAYDAAINLYSSFGYFPDIEEDRRVLENLLASLKPGGVLLMELMGKEVLARDFRERRFFERDGLILLERARIVEGWGAVETHWTLIRGARRRDRSLRTRLYSAAVLGGMLRRVGFASVAVYGSLYRAPYDHRAERLVLLARKPALDTSNPP